MFRKRKGQRQQDAEQWELNRLQTAGTLQRGAIDTDFESDEPSIKIATHHLTPPFLDGSSVFTRQKDPISATRDPQGDLATFAKKGSEVVAERRLQRDRKRKSGDTGGLAGTAMGDVLGVKEVAEEDTDHMYLVDEDDTLEVDTRTPAQQRLDLPAYNARADVLKLIRDHQVVIIIGETGSGKTTQLTQFLNEDGYAKRGIIGCTQPRRVAAMSVAKRVSEEMEVKLGEEVGYTVRFDDTTSDKTVIKYMTDGILLRETLTDSNLDKYSCIIMDEAHERTLNTDVILGLLKNLLVRRADIKLIITSATMNAQRFSDFFGGAPQYTIPGRTFPVDIHYSRIPIQDYVKEAVTKAALIHTQSQPGDILIFMTGQEDIDITCDLLAEKLKQLDDPPPLEILPMYSTLPPEQQARIFDKAKKGHRKVIVSTNIAETSLTLDGIKYVIDTGYSKMKVYNTRLGMESLLITPISKANADQRAGRAGRTSHGTCYRLYTERASREEMYQQQIPEIQRTNLANTLLLLKSLGVDDLLKFPFLDPPPRDTVVSSLYELWSIGALDNFGELTPLGKRMTRFPLQPALSKLLLTSAEKGCSEEMVIIVSMLSVPTIFLRPKERKEEADIARSRFLVPESDHLTLLNVFTQWRSKNYNDFWCRRNFIQSKSLKRAKDIKDQIEEIMKSSKLSVTSSGHEWDIVRKCIASGYFFQAAQVHGMSDYINLRTGMKLQLHPTSALFESANPPQFVVYHELMLTSKEFISVVTAVEPEWLIEYGSVFYFIRKKAGEPTKKRAIEEQLERDLKRYQEDKEKKNEKKVKVKKPVVQVGINKARTRRGF